MNTRFKFWPWLVLLTLPWLLLLPLLLTGTLSYRHDTWFHLMRIYEIRQAMLHQALPTLGSWFTFGQAGQLIQGLYPSQTLLPLVAITNWLAPVQQVYCIFGLILCAIATSNYLVFKASHLTTNQALLAALTVTYSIPLINLLVYGQLPLALIFIFMPPIFWSLYQLQTNTPHPATATVLGLNIGLTLLTHLPSAFILILLVVLIAGLDLISHRHRFLSFVQAGCWALGIGLPTLVTILVASSQTLAVAKVAQPSFFQWGQLFEEHWHHLGIGPYFGYTPLTLLALTYLALTLWRHDNWRPLKIASLTLFFIYGSNLTLQPLIELVQFPQRFYLYSAQLAIFICLVHLCQQPLGKGVTTIFYIGLASVILFSAAKTVFHVHQQLQAQTTWQAQPGYHRRLTKITNQTYQQPAFINMRTYRDYLPIEQAPYVKAGKKAFFASEYARDVNQAHSVRPSHFSGNDLHLDKTQPIDFASPVTVNPPKRQHSVPNGIDLWVHLPKSGYYDLPIWQYHYLSYQVLDNGQSRISRVSKQGRLQLKLQAGDHHLQIRLLLPTWLLAAYLTSATSLALLGLYLLCQKRPPYKSKNKAG